MYVLISVTTNGNETVTIYTDGNKTKTVTETVTVTGEPIPETESITKTSTITDILLSKTTQTIVNGNITTTIVTTETKANACYDADKIDPRNTTVNYPYLGLIQLRTVGSNKYNPIIPITTLNGRTNGYGGNLKFDSNALLFSSYDDFKMRRKAEYLKYRGVNNPGFKTNEFSSIVSNQARKTYSSAKLRQIALENANLTCNTTVLTPPSNSGIRDPNFAGYYLSPLVQFKNYL